MANHCWNEVTIRGSEETLDKLEALFANYEQHDYFKDFGNSFFPEDQHADDNPYGTKWWDFNIERDNTNVLSIAGDSAWSPPIQLIAQISEEYTVTCTLKFYETGMDFAGTYEWLSGALMVMEDVNCAQHFYTEDGITNVIDNYLYDDDQIDGYTSAEQFIERLGLGNLIDSQDLKDLEELFMRHGKQKLLKNEEIISELRGVLTDLNNLSMNGLAGRVNLILKSVSEKLITDKQNET